MTAILLLAAGGSRRLGQPKQLVMWRGKPLVRDAAETALAAGLGPVVGVLGAAAAECREALEGLDVTLIENPGWSDGMGGSIATGMQVLMECEEIDAVIITLCDMPFLTSEVFHRLEHAGRKNTSGRVATRHDEAAGPPAWFSRAWFPRLAGLAGQEGARALFRDGGEVERIDIPEAAVDLDTPGDLERLRQADQCKASAIFSHSSFTATSAGMDFPAGKYQ